MEIKFTQTQNFNGFANPKELAKFKKLVKTRLGDELMRKEQDWFTRLAVSEEAEAAKWILNPKNTQNLNIYFEPDKVLSGSFLDKGTKLYARDKRTNSLRAEIYNVSRYNPYGDFFAEIKRILAGANE